MDQPKEQLDRAQGYLWFGNAVLGILALSLAGLWGYFNFIYEPSVNPQRTARIAEEVEERLTKHSDAIMAEATDLASETLPPLGDALYDRARADYPRYIRTLTREGNVFAAEVEQIFIAQVKARYRDYLRKHRQIVAKEFPEHASKEKLDALMKEFELTANKLIERYYLDEFRKESEETVALWKKIDPIEASAPDAPPLEEQLAEYLADWMVLAFSDEAQEVAADQVSAR